MNRPKATRLGLSGIAVIVCAIAAFVPSFASGDVSSTAIGLYGPTGATTANPVPGSATDVEVVQNFTYSDGGVDEDLKKWIVDTPAGLAGNPNAIPVADRCTAAQFDATDTWELAGPASFPAQRSAGTCPSTSRVGFAKLYVASDGKNGNGTSGATIPAGAPLGSSPGTIYILESGQDVPTILGTVVTLTVFQSPICTAIYGTPTAAPCQIYRRTTSTLGPETNLSPNNNGDTDFRIRTIPNEDVTKPIVYGPTASGFADFTLGGLAGHITRIDQHLFSHADQNTSNPRFLTMPARLDAWDSFSYSTAYLSNTAATLFMDPVNPAQPFSKSAADTVTPTQTPPTFGTSASAALSSGARGGYPGLTVKVADSDPIGHDQAKKFVTTLPEAVSVNVNALNNVCSVADRDADTCAAAAKIGTATIKTPLISAGLTGRVYMVKGDNPGLPFLSIFVDGAVKFRLDATTKFVGPNFNQIETTFDSLPQTPFTDFSVDITGGSSTSSLLFNRSCPTDGSSPNSGSTAFALTGYSNPTVSSSSSNSFEGCYGVDNPSKKSNCVKRSKELKVSPKGLISKAEIKNVQLLVGKKSNKVSSKAKDGGPTFKFKYTLKKKGYKLDTKYYYGYRVEYNDGKVIKTKTNTFKTCK